MLMTRAVFRQRLDRAQTSFWFVPVIMSIVAIVLGRLLLWVDALLPDDVFAYSTWIFSAGPAETRSALLSMAGTVLATAGIVFSLLTLPMSVAAAQFGSRLLRVYLRDRT